MPTIKYSDNPNEETAFVTQDGGQKNRAVLTAAVSGTIKYPDNPNSTKVTVTVDGVEHKAIAVADISGGGGGGGGAVESVNGKTGAVVLDAEDVGALPADTPIPEPGIPQYETMPTPTASNVDEIAQYSGDTIEEAGASATISQTTGSGLTDLSVNVATFEQEEQPTGDEQVEFVCTSAYSAESLSPTSISNSTYGWTFTIDTAVFLESFKSQYTVDWSIVTKLVITAKNEHMDDFGVAVYSNDTLLVNGSISATTSDYGIDVSVIGTENESFDITYTPGTEEVWEKDSVEVDLADYGVSFSGSASVNDALTVDYTAAVAGITNGYFYKNVAEYSDPSIAIEQTTGSTLSNLAVDLDTFVETEQPTGDESVDFVASVSSGNIFASPVQFASQSNYAYVDTAKVLTYIATRTDHTDFNYISIRHTAENTNQISFWFHSNVSSWLKYITVNVSDSDMEDIGITLSDYTVYSNNKAQSDWVDGVVSWEKDDESVNISDYGITFNGTPADGDTLTVNYTAPAPIGYHWEQIDVQPGGGSGSIAWAVETDLPANWSPTDVWSTTPIYTIAGGLPDGTYEYYFQVLNSSDSVENIAPVTYKMLFTINNTSCTVNGNIGYVINGDFMSDGNQTPRNSDYSNIFGMVGSDLKIFRAEPIFCTDIPGYIDPVPEVKGCFKITAIKNVATGESYVPTAELYDGTNGPQYTTYYSTNIKSCALAPEPYIPSYHRNTNWSIDNSTPYVYIGNSISTPSNSSAMSEIDIYLKTDSGGEFHLVVENNTDSYVAKVIKATGNIANAEVFYNDSAELAVDLNLPSDTTDYLHISIGIKGSSTGVSSIWRPSDISDFTNTLILTKVGGTIDANNLGIILQYDGTTTASYTNGYFYRADGTLVSIPESLNASNYSINDFSVTVDAPNLITALMNYTSWSKSYLLEMLNNDYNWTIYYDADNQSITSIYWDAYGQMTDADILQCFTVSTSLTGSVNCTFKMAYTPGYKEVQNPSWTRVDTQPGSSLPSQTGNAGKVLATNGTDASWGNSLSFLAIPNETSSGRWEFGPDALGGLLITQPGFGSNSRLDLNLTWSSVCSLNSAATIGSSSYKWANVYTKKINNGNDITVPNVAGTMVVAVPPTTPNTTWVLKATVDANGDATVAWVQEV